MSTEDTVQIVADSIKTKLSLALIIACALVLHELYRSVAEYG